MFFSSRPGRLARVFLILLLSIPSLVLAQSAPNPTVRDTVFDIQQRFLEQFSTEALQSMTPDQVLANLSAEERHILGTDFVRFTVNVPVVVSVIRDPWPVAQFWLADLGFEKTDLKARIRHETEWEVWQATFPAGEVGLGVNGIIDGDSNGSIESYAIAVAPVNADDELVISDLYHPSFGLDTVALERPAWADEESRYFIELPDQLVGQQSVQLLRTRRNDGQLIHFANVTPYPSTAKPDQVVLTLGDDPATSAVVQWRTGRTENAGKVVFQEKSRFTGFEAGDDYLSASSEGPVVIDSPREDILAEYDTLDDYPGGLLELRPEPGNDPVVNRHIVPLRDLKPATTYVYAVGNGEDGGWSAPREFTTDPADPEAFSFIYMGDVQHGFEEWEPLVRRAYEYTPNARFIVMTGDMVNRGPERDDWDAFFHASEGVYSEQPLVPVLGNHEYNGQEPTLYLDQFMLPENGPRGMEERLYSFRYGDAFFAIIDGSLKGEEELAKQASWLDQQLAQADATWKFVAIHQPIYGSRPTQDEPELRQAFLPILDRHGVDLMLQGHTHAYLRTQPMKGGEVVPEGEGTVYLVANSGTKFYEVGGFQEKYGVEPAVMIADLATYQVIDIDGGELRYRAYDVDGAVVDAFTLEKTPVDEEEPVDPEPEPEPPASGGGSGGGGWGPGLLLAGALLLWRRRPRRRGVSGACHYHSPEKYWV
ncbi:metallophosphoesterase [Alloalcanivorax xenomutans]|uniref:metallophosphoesterase n=1 Tax=Alloalcanivorax xenomutans TaxID=1094342 RepID=UPI003D9B2E6E